MRWPEPRGRTCLVDPCAGDGTAILTLRRLWVESLWPDVSRLAGPWHSEIAIRACELEGERASALWENLVPNTDSAFEGDAFRLCALASEGGGATVLYLNPPYDHDREFGRLEHRFLSRFAQHLCPGAGFLFFLVPGSALEASADLLAREFLDLRAWRLPDPEYQAFGQVLVVGRRAAKPLASASFAPTIVEWARNPGSLPILPERCPDPFEVLPDADYYFSYAFAPFDLTAAVGAFRPFEDAPVGTTFSARELLGARFETAMPPKPVHIALALAAGMFNGHRLEPNEPRRHPALLAKGVFHRELVPVSDRRNGEGDVVATVEIERPSLCLTVLRLDDYTFHQLEPGTIPNGGDDVAAWNAADLIANYDRSLARLLRDQFPALHDPHRRDHEIALPALARKPFRAQAHAVQASLKLLARGINPFLVAEVGTGKSTMALTVAAALSPEHYEATAAEIRRLGGSGRLPRVEKTLVVCPPHLLKSWSDQAAAVVPGFRVQIVETAADLARPAEIYILSRETAKLGHGLSGIEQRCPRCGSEIETSAAANVSRRLRCEAVRRKPCNLAARIARTLAMYLATALPRHPLIADLVTAPALRRRIATLKESGTALPMDEARLVQFHDTVLCAIETLYRSTHDRQPIELLCRLVDRLHTALGTARRSLLVLRALVDGEPPATAWGPLLWIQNAVSALEDQLDSDEDPATEIRDTELLRILEWLHENAAWEESAPCGEPLFQAVAPRRYPLAQLIQKRHARDFGLLVLDECHEFNSGGSAQAKAAHRLSGLPGVPTLALTGSLMGGYASSLFPNFWALSPIFRSEFGRDDRAAFVARYGFRKLLVPTGKAAATKERGRHTDREIGHQAIGEAPGLMPTFILRHLLPVAALVHKDDLDIDLPPLTETPVPIQWPDDPLAGELRNEYTRLQNKLLDRIRTDRSDEERAGRLLGALVELPSYLDRATDDQPPFEIRYPAILDEELITTGKAFPAAWRTPKEAWLLARVAELHGKGEKILVFLRHTGTPALPTRLLALLKTITPRVAWLDAKKVPTGKREAWIDQNVLAKGVEVLLVNPNAVRTGLNNLVSFSAGLWYELDLSTTTYRQAIGRLHRIGQTRPVTIETPYYPGTAQQITFELIAKKTTASLQVDGLDLQAALEAAGASADENAALGTALSLGQAVYRALEGRR